MTQSQPWTPLISRFSSKWSTLSLTSQFAAAALVVLGCGMSVLGFWVSSRIERGVLQNTATGSALYINSFVEQHIQELGSASALKPASAVALDALLEGTPLGRKVVGIKIWAPDGTVVYSNHKDLVGRKFPLTERLQTAFRGEVSAELSAPEDEGGGFERAARVPLFDIYSPVVTASNHVLAVAEFHEEATLLQAELRKARLQSWYIVALVTLAMLSILFGIVRKGSQTIAAQEQALRDRITELSSLLAQNKSLHSRIDEIHLRSLETNDLVLRRIGLELHDGPAQLISLALLRLDFLRQADNQTGQTPIDEFERIRTALVDSLAEIRNMSAGLTLPQLDNIGLAEALSMAARLHERRTATAVKCELNGLPLNLSNALKACLYRFVQEALNNAFRHGGGKGQTVRGSYVDSVLEVEVCDAGPGFEPDNNKHMSDNRLGLAGMRDRVASLGGTLEIRSRLGQGTRLAARFTVVDDANVRNEAIND